MNQLKGMLNVLFVAHVSVRLPYGDARRTARIRVDRVAGSVNCVMSKWSKQVESQQGFYCRPVDSIMSKVVRMIGVQQSTEAALFS